MAKSSKLLVPQRQSRRVQSSSQFLNPVTTAGALLREIFTLKTYLVLELKSLFKKPFLLREKFQNWSILSLSGNSYSRISYGANSNNMVAVMLQRYKKHAVWGWR